MNVWGILQRLRRTRAEQAGPGKALPRPVMINAGFRRALPWLLVSVALATLALIDQLPWWSLAVFAGCAIWRHRIEKRGSRLPSLQWRLAVFIPTALGVFLHYWPNWGADGMLTFLVALLALKILELRTHRDFLVVALLGFFMVLAAFFYNQGLALSIYLSISVATNIIALIRCHDGGRQHARRSSVVLALSLMAQTVPLVALLFVVFPRFQGKFLRADSKTGTMGMSDRLQPGGINALVQSDEKAFRVRLTQGGQLNASSLYWRGLVLSKCESPMSWSVDHQMEVFTTPAEQIKLPPGAQQFEQDITIITQGERWLFALDRPLQVKTTSLLHVDLNGSVIRSREPIYGQATYRVTSAMGGINPGELSVLERKFYTAVPADFGARSHALVQKWLQAAPPQPGAARELDIIRQARLFFRDGGFTYTLTPDALPAEGALDAFLFTTRRGFCEHYAAAFSTLLRAAGLPTRIIVGYQGGEYNSWNWGGKSGHYLVRQSDAHAWSEVWITGHGWQREDPTAVVAPERVSFGAESYAALTADGPLSAASRLERLAMLNAPGSWHWVMHNIAMAWDGMDQQWNMLILGYDTERQADALQDLGLGNLNWVQGATLALSAAFAILASAALAVRAFDRVQPQKIDAAARLYERFCRQVARLAGVQRGSTEGPLDFSRRAVQALPEQSRQIAAITDLYVLSRYAPKAHSDFALRTLEALQEAVEKFRSTAKPAPSAPPAIAS